MNNDGSAKANIGSALTDGTGVSPFTVPKLIKDAVADFLLALPAALIVAGVTDVPQDTKAAMVAGFAIIGVAVKVFYRAALRWATT
jgi:hypothetical protein